jgi:hypothetical protein
MKSFTVLVLSGEHSVIEPRLTELLKKTGTRVTVRSFDDLNNTKILSGSFFVLISDKNDTLISNAVQLVRNRVPHISVLRTEKGALVGPTYFEPGTACINCASLRLLSNSLLPAQFKLDGSRLLEDYLWQDMLFREIYCLKTGYASPLTINHYIECDSIAGRLERHKIIRAPRCQVCRLSDLPTFTAWQV